ncbi:Hypothetical protein HVR_LOCUS316 [uncultured virus]|nr:Hypothetical protein HVR_LOCUS316 [uncultured virus]
MGKRKTRKNKKKNAKPQIPSVEITNNSKNKDIRKEKGIVLGRTVNDYMETTVTGDICKYHKHKDVALIETGEHHIIGFHIWDDDNEEWLVAKSIDGNDTINEMMVFGSYFTRIFSSKNDFFEYLSYFGTIHAILSDEQPKPVEILIDDVRISLKPTDRSATKEAIRCNLFTEYEALKDKLYNDFQRGRFLVLKGVVSMIKFDPAYGDKRGNMSEEDIQYWKDLHTDIVEGGKLLYKFDGMAGMRDPLVWLFIPQRFHRDIDMKWSGIGK